MNTRSAHVSITGRVQRVGFRAWTQRQATARGLAGWVCNRRDGSVEAVFCGDPDSVVAMIEACRQGPAGSHVVDIRISDHADFPREPFTLRQTY